MSTDSIAMPVADQAAHLRAMVQDTRRPAPVLALASGKGGVGKSNIAVNLSVCLSVKGFRVTLVDLDMGLANADVLMGLQPKYTLAHVLSGVRSIEEVACQGPAGVRFVAGPSGIHELADLTDFQRQNLILQIGRLKNSADLVVLDCGAGLSRNVTSFALTADHVLVVTTPQPPALTDAYATVKALLRDGFSGRLSLTVNMAATRADAAAAFQRVAGVAQKFLNYPLAGQGFLLHDRAVELAVMERCPFVIRYPASNASSCVSGMATDIARTLAGSSARASLLSRVAGLFV